MKVKWLAIIGLIIIVVTSGLHDWKYLQFEIMKDYLFNDWLSIFGGNIGMLLWAWALKKILFEDKAARYVMDYGIDLCIVDMVFVTLYNPYAFNFTKIEWFAVASGFLIIKLLLNKFWHWFRIQKII